MMIYHVKAKMKRKNFMEPEYIFEQEMDVIADNYDDAVKYVRDRLKGGGNEEVSMDVSSKKVMALFDVRNREEHIIV